MQKKNNLQPIWHIEASLGRERNKNHVMSNGNINVTTPRQVAAKGIGCARARAGSRSSNFAPSSHILSLASSQVTYLSLASSRAFIPHPTILGDSK